MSRTGVIWIVLGFASVARAQEQAAEPTYQNWIDVALEASQRGDLATARDAFQRAHQLEPSARTLRGLGTIEFQAGRHPAAFVALSAALAEPHKPLPPDLAVSVRALVEQVRAKVALCELVGLPEHTRVAVDGGDPLRDAQGRIVLGAGPHRLELSAPGREPAVLEIEPAPGTLDRIRVQLREIPRPTLLPAAAPLSATSSAPAQPTAHAVVATSAPAPSKGRTWTWVAAAGVPVFVTAAALAWWKTDETGEAVDAQCRHEHCDDARRDALIEDSPLATYELMTNVAWTLAGASLVAAGVAFVLEGEPGDGWAKVGIATKGVVLHAVF